MATSFTQVATEAEVERPSVSKLRGNFAESSFVEVKTVALIVGPRKLPQNKIHKRRLQVVVQAEKHRVCSVPQRTFSLRRRAKNEPDLLHKLDERDSCEK